MKLPGRPSIRQPVVLAGRSVVSAGRVTFENSAASALVFPADEECTVECGHGYAHLLLEFDKKTLLRHGLDLTGYTHDMLYRLKPFAASDPSRLARLGSIATVLAFNLKDLETLESPIVLELKQALLSSFLIENGLVRGMDQMVLAGSVAFRTLRDYVHSNWRKPLTIEDIARECNVSARSVFLQFRKEIGLSPMSYLRNVRLDESRRLLMNPNERISITNIALACGFSSMGHFARRYEERFGELPSQTVWNAEHALLLRRSP